MTQRGQIEFPTLEIGLGLIIIVGILSLVMIGGPTTDTRTTQLDQYAADIASVLVSEPMVGNPGTRDPERLDQRIDTLVPGHLRYHVTGPAGEIGPPPPPEVKTGTASRATPHGELTVTVWYNV